MFTANRKTRIVPRVVCSVNTAGTLMLGLDDDEGRRDLWLRFVSSVKEIVFNSQKGRATTKLKIADVERG